MMNETANYPGPAVAVALHVLVSGQAVLHLGNADALVWGLMAAAQPGVRLPAVHPGPAFAAEASRGAPADLAACLALRPDCPVWRQCRPSAARSTPPTSARTYMHEHVFVLTADVQQNYPEEWGTRTPGSPTPSASSRRWPAAACGPSSIPPSSASAATSRASSASPSRCRSSTSSSPPAATPTTTCRSSSTTAGPALNGPRSTCPTRWSTCSSATSRTASPARACGPAFLKCAIDAPGLTQRRRAGHAGGRQGAPAHRRPDHGAHPPRSQTGLVVQAGAVRRGRRRPGTRRARAQRRLHRRRPPQRAGRGRASCSAWIASGSTLTPAFRHGRTSWWRCAGGASPRRWCSRTTRPATSTGSTRSAWR